MRTGVQLERWNELAHEDLIRELRRCFDDAAWAAAVAARRPFAGAAELLAAAAAEWQAMDEEAWRQALRACADPDVGGGDETTQEAVRVALDLYRRRFGYAFVAAPPGLGAEETLMLIRIRLGHEEAAELRRSRDEYRTRARRCLERHAGAAS